MCLLIEESDVTSVNLAIELERAVVEHMQEEDESIYVVEDGWFPFWIRVLKDAGYVSFKSHTNFTRSSSHQQRLELCNQLNSQNFLITAYVDDDRLIIDYVLNFRDGLLRESFIRSCRQFASNIERGLNKIDLNNEFILPPGKTEPEDESSH